MIQITADTRRAVVTNKELLTTGSAGIQVQFTLSEDWAGLAKVAVFRQGDEGEKVDCVLDSSLTCVVPSQVLTTADEVVFCGIYGSNGQGTIIIPTIWASAGVVRPGTEPNTPATAEPTPEIWAQILGVAQSAEGTANDAYTMAANAQGYIVEKIVTDAVDDFVENTVPAAIQGIEEEGTTQVQAVEDKGDEVIASIPSDYTDLVDDVADLSRQISDLESDLSSLGEELETVEDAISESEDRSTSFTFYKNGIRDIVLNGQAAGVYDGCALIDGVNVKVTSLNGQATDYNCFFLSNQVNKANGQNNFISDILPVGDSNRETINGREASSSLEISLLKTRCEYSVDAANEYLKAHPIRVWFETPNFSTASSFYYYLNCVKTGYYLNIGTTQALPQLSTGDTLSFGTGRYSIDGSTGTVPISGDIFSIEDGATVSSSGNLSTKELANLQSRIDEKVSKDGWNEVLPINTTFFDGVNYFDLSKAIVYNDRFVNNSGTVVSQSNVTSVVCPVKSNTTYWFYAPGMNRFFVVENDSDTFNIGSSYTVLNNSSETNPTSITTGATARYVCIYFANYIYDFTQNSPILNEKHYNGTNNPYVAEDYLPKVVTNPLRNANVLIFGDSITDSCNITVNANDETTAYTWKNPSNSYTDAGGNIVHFNMWPFMLKNLGIFSEIRNYARSGASYKDATRTAGEERQNLSYQITVALNDLDNPNGVFDVDEFTPDIVIFALGTNDGVPNDTYQDAMAKTVLKTDGYSIDTDATLANLDRSKFCEAAQSAFLRTRIAFPEAQFYCVLPIQRANDEVNGQNLNTYLREMARRYGCVIIDGYAESGIIRDTNVWNALGATLKDGLHPNDKGQNMMFRMIYGALKSHYIKDDVMN